MSRIILFNKPYGVLCQFTDPDGALTLADFIPIKNVYAAGRLDKDSEGLLLLTDDGKLQNQITHPKHKLEKTYWVQVEGLPDKKDLQLLEHGIDLKDGLTQPARVKFLDEPESLWEREPPIRSRKNQPTSWLSISIKEGKNRQVRRMTASVGCPTLRLVRTQIGPWKLNNLRSGEWVEIKPKKRR